MMAEWMRTTDTGDRAELEDLPEDSPLWHDVAATADTCLGSDCPQFQECFVTRMRQRAAASRPRDRQPSPALRRRAVRQSTYGEVIPECTTRSSTRRTSSRTSPRSTSASRSATIRLDELGRDVERVLNTGAIADRRWRRCAGWCGAWTITRARSSAGLVLARHMRAGRRRGRLRIGPDWYGDILDEGLGAGERARRAGSGDAAARRDHPAAASKASEDAADLARRAGEMRDQLRSSCSRPSDPHYVYFVEMRGPRRVPAGRADRRVGDPPGGVVRPDARHGADVRDADRRRVVRLHPRPARRREAADIAGRVRVRLHRAGGSLPAAPDAPAQVAATSATRSAREMLEILRRTRGRAFVLFTSYAVLRAVHAEDRFDLPYPLLVQGDGAAERRCWAVPLDAECRAAGDLVVLAGRGRRGRAVELRDHRQAAVRLARRPDYRGPNRGHHRRGRRRVPGLPGAARRPGDAAGAWAA